MGSPVYFSSRTSGELAYSPSLCLVFPLGRPEQYSPGYEALDPSSEELEAGPSKIGEPVHEAHVPCFPPTSKGSLRVVASNLEAMASNLEPKDGSKIMD